MATIVIHAGMGKTGSSTIQRWLHDNSTMLREHGFTVVAAPESDSGEIAFAPHDGGTVNSGWIVRTMARRPELASKLAGALAESIAQAGERHGDIVLFSESFSTLFYRFHAETLTGLQRLASRHRLRVAYYVRPQDTRLEASWRQIGYRTRLPPSVYIERTARFLHYTATRDGVRALAPDVEFEPRPFRRDMLDRGDVIADFAGRFLGVEATGKEWVNRGLPLEIVNVMHAEPTGMFTRRAYGSSRVKAIKRLLDDDPIPEGEHVALSRQVLRKYAYERYGAENTELGWWEFVPPPDDPRRTPGLDALDELWRPRASPAELSFLYRVLGAAILD